MSVCPFSVCSFFIILRGSVSLLFDSNYQQAMAAANVDSLLKGSIGTKGATGGTTTGEKKYRSRFRYGTEIEKLGAGDFFGHNALSQRDESSLHTALANEPVELLAIRAEVFTKVLLQHFQEDFHTKAEFLSSIEFFSGWSPHLIRQLIFTLRERRYHSGECIFRQDIPTHCVHLVKSGSIKLSTHCSRKPPPELMQKFEPEKDFLTKILAEGQPRPRRESQTASISRVSLISGVSRISLVSSVSQAARGRSTSSPGLPSLSRQTSTAPASSSNEVKKKAKHTNNEKKPSTIPVHRLGFKLHEPSPESVVEICNLGPKELLGDIEAICELKYHLFNAVCMTTTVVYEVDLFHVEQLLHKKTPRTLYSILQHIVQRVGSWHSRHKCVKFFEPLTTLLSQVDKRLAAEGANRPVRRQHNYDAHTLALMATRSLGKPILSDSIKKGRRSLMSVPNDHFNSKPFSLLYGCASASPNPSEDTFGRCHSAPSNYTMNRTLDPSLSPGQVTLPNCRSGAYLRHHSKQSSRRIPRPIRAKKYSFDSPPPRQYCTKPNLMSSARFPAPLPSPYAIQEEMNLSDSLDQREEKPEGNEPEGDEPKDVEPEGDEPEGDEPEGDEPEEDKPEEDGIETIELGSPPIHGVKQRCKSASVHQVYAKPPLPPRPKTACSFPTEKRATPISIDDFPLVSTVQSKKVSDVEVDVSPHSNGLPATTVQQSPPKLTCMPIVVPRTITCEEDLEGEEYDTVYQVLSNKEVNPSVNIADSDSCVQEVAVLEEALVETIVNNAEQPNVNRHPKQVRISDNLIFLDPKSQPTYTPNTTVIVNMEAHDKQLQPGGININSLSGGMKTDSQSGGISTDSEDIPQAAKFADEISQSSDLETNIPEEYTQLQRSNQLNSSTTRSVTPNRAERDGAQEYGEISAVPMSGGQDHRGMTSPPNYKCVTMTFPVWWD